MKLQILRRPAVILAAAVVIAFIFRPAGFLAAGDSSSKEASVTLATEGAQAPGFTTKDDKGQTVNLADFAAKKNVVLYFYPKDDTPGCTKEACGFRDSIGQFASKETVVLGVSLDDEKSHTAFKEKFSLPFPLLADTDGSICKAYGVAVKDGTYPARVTFVIGKDGKIKKVFPTVKPDEHPAEVLKALQ